MYNEYMKLLKSKQKQGEHGQESALERKVALSTGGSFEFSVLVRRLRQV
jgi:hypothetical protein